jgi:hypothetical protein
MSNPSTVPTISSLARGMLENMRCENNGAPTFGERVKFSPKQE